MRTNSTQVYIGSPLRNKAFRNLTLCGTIADVVRESGLDPYLPHTQTAKPDEYADEADIYTKNTGALDNSLFAIFEITNPSHGVGMEIEHALSRNIPLLCIAEKHTKISRMLSGSIESTRIEYYSDLKELEAKLRTRITEELRLLETNKMGKFITIEGIDFTGKSTICQKLKTQLEEQEKEVILVSDPPSIPPWKDLKQFFETEGEISKLSEAFLLLAARLDNYERIIEPAIHQADIVISDRHTDSWFAYQAYRLRAYFNDSIEESLRFLMSINNALLRNFPVRVPDLTILITDEPTRIIQRASSRSGISKYEQIETQRVVQEIYLQLAKEFPRRFRMIEAKGKDLDTVYKQVYTLCHHLLEWEQ